MECEFWVSKINFGFLYPAKGVQNLFWAVGSPKFILDDSHPCTFNHTLSKPVRFSYRFYFMHIPKGIKKEKGEN
jgi:hypothetical protein